MKFFLVATEITDPSRKTRVPVTVHLVDTNDNGKNKKIYIPKRFNIIKNIQNLVYNISLVLGPVFQSSQYSVQVQENVKRGTTIANVRAVDVDSGKYGTGGIRYTELRGQLASMLSLDPITGVIRTGSEDDDNELKEELETFFDREKLDFHYLTVEARDDVGKGNRNTVELLIYVTDVNDNPPVFESKQYEAYLTEVI